MTADEMAQCLAQMRAADAMLLEAGELLIAAHLSMAIELLALKLAAARPPAERIPVCG